MNLKAATLALLFAAVGLCQSPATLKVSGKYFLRHVQFTTGPNNNITDARSIFGSIVFGDTTWTFTGQQTIGVAAPSSFTATGAFSLDPSGHLSIANPQNTKLNINAWYGAEAIVGSTTEAPDNTFDYFVAIPAPSGVPAYSNSTIGAPWSMVALELPGASTANVRNSGAFLTLDGAGNIPSVQLKGHAAAIQQGATATQSLTGSYSLTADGTGQISFAAPTDPAAIGILLGTSPRNLYVSATGNILMAATPAGHDVLLAVKNTADVSPANLNGLYWSNGFRIDTRGDANSHTGSANIIQSLSIAISSTRVHQAVTPNHQYQTGGGQFTAAAGVVSFGATSVLPGRGNTFVSAIVSNSDQSGYEIGIGIPAPALTGSGVFVNPQGVVNAAGNAPVGNPISPGEFIAIYGSGLSTQTLVAPPPYPTSLGGVSVTIGGLPAPLYLVSPGQVNCLIPYGISTTAGVTPLVVTNGVTPSNTANIPVAATSPAIFSNNLTGLGEGAIVHLSGALVSASSPAVAGETLTLYLTGLGALQNRVSDGSAPNPPAADPAISPVSVFIDGVPSPKVLYAGINPVYPGLYQINFQVPQTPDHGQQVQVAIVTADSGTGEITMFVK